MRVDIDLDIEALGARGDGIAHLDDGRPVYVPFTVPGDRARVRLGQPRGEGIGGRLVRILSPGPDRTEPVCSHFGQCGGCAVQHLGSTAYRTWKVEILRAALVRQGFSDPPLLPSVVVEPGARRRVDLTVKPRREKVLIGFNARASHDIVDVIDCPVLDSRLVALIDPLRDLLRPQLLARDSAEIVINWTDSGADLLMVSAARLGVKGRERLSAFAERHDLARIARRHPKQEGAEVIAERRPVRVTFGGIAVAIPPGAFLQATVEGEKALIDDVVAGCKGMRKIADLYAGCGTFSLPLAAAGVMVHAVDSNPAAIAVLAAAGGATKGPLTTEIRDLGRRPLIGQELDRFDAVLFDPPRAGAAAQAARLATSKVPVVIAISCHPGTFARDARLLADGGYRLVSVRPIDQFLWSPHLELVAVFQRSHDARHGNR